MSPPETCEGGKKNQYKIYFLSQVVDTCIAFPRPNGSKKKRSLKSLAKEHLGREIQQGSEGHDPREDALAALDLMKLKVS